MQKRIESANYMAITRDRIATQNEIIVGRRDTDEAVRQCERAAAFREESKALRHEFQSLHEGRPVDGSRADMSSGRLVGDTA